MNRQSFYGAVMLAFVVLASPAHAAPIGIGTFDYTLDPALGPIFTVTSDALLALGDPDAAFLGGTVFVSDNNVEVESLSFGRIDAGDSIRLFSSLLSLFSGSARLELSFLLPGAIDVGSLDGLQISFDENGIDPNIPEIIYAGTFIDFESTSSAIIFTRSEQEPPPNAVPEPGTGVLLGFAAAASTAARIGVKRVKQSS